MILWAWKLQSHQIQSTKITSREDRWDHESYSLFVQIIQYVENNRTLSTYFLDIKYSINKRENKRIKSPMNSEETLMREIKCQPANHTSHHWSFKANRFELWHDRLRFTVDYFIDKFPLDKTLLCFSHLSWITKLKHI